MSSFKCNHDIQILFGGKDAVDRIYYCCKYVTKPQRQIDSSIALGQASLQRRQSKETSESASGNPPAIGDVQRRRVTSMIYTFTNKQEIAGPLAALYLLRGASSYTSNFCAKLPLADILKQLLDSEDYVCSLVQSTTSTDAGGRVYRSASFLDDYVHRPQSTSEMSIYEFTMKCYRRQRNNTTSVMHLFQDQHPLSNSHCVAFRRRESVPVVKGPRLNKIKDGMPEEERECNARIALVLFKPFTAVNDLLGGHSSWYGAYCEWERNRSQFVTTIMRNMNDYCSARAREEDVVIENEEEESRSDYSGDDESDVGYWSGEYDDLQDTDLGYDTRDVLSILSGVEGTGLEGAVRVFPTPKTVPPRIESILESFQEHQLVRAIAREVASNFTQTEVDCMDAEELKRWVGSAAFDNPINTKSPDDEEVGEHNVLYETDRPTTVEVIDDALRAAHVRWQSHPISQSASQVPSCCSIVELSRIFTLNELQHGAFAIIATSLLKRWRNVGTASLRTDSELESQQLLLYLGGEGGTGKSRVIQAVQEFCRSWNKPDATIIAAMTGKAASIIGGRTLASFEMALRSPSSHTAIQDLDCLIVDEVSMMSKHQLLRMDRLLRRAKRISDLPPVGADPLFIDPLGKRKATLSDFEGFHLWRSFKSVVVLRDSVRFREDPEWGAGCSKARFGEWTPEFVNMINKRIVDHTSGAQTRADVPPGTVFVTPDNDARTAINSYFVSCTASILPENQLPIRVIANFKGALNKLSQDDITMIMGLPDTKFGRMAPYLDLIPGMPIQITQNVRTKKGVANGTMGHLHSVHFPNGTTFTRAKDARTGVVVLIPNCRPLYALVRINRGQEAVPLVEGNDPALFPVFPDAKAFKKVTVPLTPSSTGESRSLKINLEQFPFVCAVGATAYKVQGESLRSLVVVDWKAEGRGTANRPQQAYLMVSRVVKRDGLVCLKPFTSQHAEWSKPPQSAIDEENRLLRESEVTLQTFYASLL